MKGAKMRHYKFSLDGKDFEVITYLLDELPETSKQKAIQEHLDFLNAEGITCENESGELEVEYDYLDACKDSDINEVIENIDVNEYEYDFNGDLVGITTYMSDNKPTGKKTIRINKQEIEIIEA